MHYVTGQYQYQFTQLGTFYVWSGYVDVWGIKNYAGQIEVVEKTSSIGEVRVTVAGKEAIQAVGGLHSHSVILTLSSLSLVKWTLPLLN